MEKLLYFDIGGAGASESLGGGTFSIPELVQYGVLKIQGRLQKTVNGTPTEISRGVAGLKATLGFQDARPTYGTFQLKVGTESAVLGTNLTQEIEFNAPSSTLLAQLLALTGGLTDTQKVSGSNKLAVWDAHGSWYVKAADGTQITLTVEINKLAPISFVYIRSRQISARWITQLRPTQAPVGFTNAFARVVPAAPSIARTQAGSTSESGFAVNEVQTLTVPAEFRGSYYIQRGTKQTGILLASATKDQIASALAPLADAGGTFTVRIPLNRQVEIEFAGSMAGQGFDEMVAHVANAPEGDLNFTIPLDKDELEKLLQMSPDNLAVVPLEIVAQLENEHDPEILEPCVLLRQDVSIRMAATKPELGEVLNIDFQRPTEPKSYVAFNSSQLLTGNKSYVSDDFCDGESNSFVHDHNLATYQLSGVELWQTGINGARLTQGTDYTFIKNSENSATLTVMGDPPAPGSLMLVINAAPPTASFAEGLTLEIDQVNGLGAALTDLGGRVATLETAAGIGGLTSRPDVTVPTVVAAWDLESVFEVYPLRRSIKIARPDTLANLDKTNLVRTLGLLAAVHDDAAGVLTVPLPAASESFIGNVYQNTSGGTVVLPGLLGHKSVNLLDQEYAACDGRLWYRVAKYGSEKSYYPTDFDRTLFELAVNSSQLSIGQTFSLQLGLELAIIGANTECQWVFVIEHGVIEADTSPSGLSPINLKDVAWNAAPMLQQPILLQKTPCAHTFGITILRSAASTFVAKKILYGSSAAADASPATANFALRGRLIRFDTEDSQSNPSGFVALLGLDRGSGDASSVLGKAQITGPTS